MLSTLLKKTNSIVKNKFEISGETYSEDALIGEGAYAYVYRVKDSRGNSFALKKLICQTESQIKETKKEIKLLSVIKHENVLSLLGSSFHTNSKKQTEAFLLLPLYGKSAQDIIDQGQGYPHCAFQSKTDVLKILVHSIEALKAIHSCGYTHCDFKPANILLDEHMNAVVTDFGSASALTTDISSRSEALSMQEHAADNTTASFRPPELFDTPSHCTIDGKVDVWSLGCTLYALMFSRTPFENPADGLSVLAILSSSFTIPANATKDWPDEYHTLIKASLRTDFNTRLSIEELQILASMLPDPSVVVTTSSYASPVFEAAPGLTVGNSSSGENLFTSSTMSPTSEGTVENFAHFEDFGNFESNTTVFNATATAGKKATKKSKDKTAAVTSKMSQLSTTDEKNTSSTYANSTSEACDTVDNNNDNKDMNDSDSDFGDFVQADVETVETVTPPAPRNVSMSCEAHIMKMSRTGPFRTKNDVKKKVKLIMDNKWLCVKKIEGHPGKIYFDGTVTQQSTIVETTDPNLGDFVLTVKNLELSDERRHSLTQSQKQSGDDEGTDKSAVDHSCSAASNSIDIGFETLQERTLWCEALRGQVALCSE